MGTKTTKATLLGAGAASVLVAWAIFLRLLGDLTSELDVGVWLRLQGFLASLVAAGALVALSRAPLRVRPSPTFALAVGGGLVLVGTLMFSALATFALAVVVGAAVALVMADMLPHDAPMRARLGVSLGSMLSMLGVAILVPAALAFLPFDFVGDLLMKTLVLTIVALLSTRFVLWIALRQVADEARTPATPTAPTAWAAPTSAPPPGWFWGKLHDPASGTRVLGYRYVDPVGGASFHVLADLASVPPAAALQQAGFRGRSTVRLGAHETLHVEGLPAEVVAMQQADFDRPRGTVILALTRSEKAALGLPEAPPWAGHYLPHAA